MHDVVVGYENKPADEHPSRDERRGKRRATRPRLADDPTTGLVRQQGGGECLVVTLPAAHPHASTRPAALGGSRGSCVSAAGFSDTGT